MTLLVLNIILQRFVFTDYLAINPKKTYFPGSHLKKSNRSENCPSDFLAIGLLIMSDMATDIELLLVKPSGVDKINASTMASNCYP